MDKNQKKENSKKKNSLGSICLRIFISIITMIGVASHTDLDLREWLWYNLYYRPLYFFFSDFLYATFFYRFINITLIIYFILFFSILGLFLLEKEKGKEKERSKKKFYTYMLQYPVLIVVIGFFALGAYFLYPFVLDIRYIVKKEYLIETSDITRYERYIYQGSKGECYEYKLYTYTPVEEKRTGLSSYEFFELNEYQYKELKNYQSNLSMKDTVTNKKIKVYYLPNSRVILKYDFIN